MPDIIPEDRIAALTNERDLLAREVERLRIRQDQSPSLGLFMSQCPLGIILWNSQFEVSEWNPLGVLWERYPCVKT